VYLAEPWKTVPPRGYASPRESRGTPRKLTQVRIIRDPLAVYRLTYPSASAITLDMTKTTPPAVVHAGNCICLVCREERAAEVRRRIEAMSGPVFSRLGVAKAQPGSLRALNRRYGGSR
jgi:hypothetical protein